jgi:SAM-dependent methyltransferase
MHPKFVDILCCPQTGAGLKLKVDEISESGTIKNGTLTTDSGAHSYPILNGIPRFVDKEVYAQSFGYEWRKWSRVQFEAENVSGPMAGHTEKMFDSITGFSRQFLKDKLVVDFGCGPGRFLDIVRRRGGIAVGIDMSMAVEPARENFRDDPNVLIVQGDILNPPFREATFDAGYSIGVLHHTPDPAGGLQKLAAVVKENGLVACCVYQKGGFYDFPSVAMYRTIHNAAKGLIGNRLALSYAYLSAYFIYHGLSLMRRIPKVRQLVPLLEQHVLVDVNLPDARWRLLDVFDAITPFHASTHTEEEVRSWFSKSDCHHLSLRPWGPTTFVGTKGKS